MKHYNTNKRFLSIFQVGSLVSFTSYFVVNLVAYHLYDNSSVESFIFSFLHILMFTFLIFRQAVLLCDFPQNILHPFNIFLLLNVIYFSVNFIKYYSYPNYYEFINENDIRFLGSSLVFISINILFSFSRYVFRKNKYDFFVIFTSEIKKRYFVLFVNVFSIAIAILILCKIFFDLDISDGKFLSMIIQMYPIFLLLSLFDYKERRNRISVFILIFGLASFFIVTGVRHVALIIFILITLFYFSNNKFTILSYNKIYNILMFIPLFIILIISPVTKFTKNTNENDLILYLNRSDLSDFAISVSANNPHPNPLHYFYNSIKWAVPGIFIEKSNLDNPEEGFLYKNGWRSSDYRMGYSLYNIDYPDTLFSTGAFVAGYFGLIFFPVVWFFLFNLFFLKINYLFFIACYISIVPLLFKIEIAPWEIVPIFRNLIITTAVFYIFLKFFKIIFNQKKNKYNS